MTVEKDAMGLSNSEKQRRYRQRHLGPGGGSERLSIFVRISTKRNLERLASHYGNTITNTVENLINEKTLSILNGLNESEQHEFYSEEPVHKRQGAK
ncbi:hypothetical protein GCM10027093_29200 [Paraburkholderia jirisanensis]|jgi:hypothetical protein